MKICHLSTVHNAFDTRILWKECASLARAGHHVILIAPVKEKNSCDTVTVQAFPAFSNPYLRMLFAPWLMLFRALKTKADLYHFHDPELLPIGLLLRLFTWKPVVYDVHEDVAASIRVRTYIPQILRRPVAWGYRQLEALASRWLTVVIAEKYYADFLPRGVPILNYPILDGGSEFNVQSSKSGNQTTDARGCARMGENFPQEGREGMGRKEGVSSESLIEEERDEEKCLQKGAKEAKGVEGDSVSVNGYSLIGEENQKTKGKGISSKNNLEPPDPGVKPRPGRAAPMTTDKAQRTTDKGHCERVSDACAHWLFYSGSVTRVRGALHHARMSALVTGVGVYSAGRCPAPLAAAMRAEVTGYQLSVNGFSDISGQRPPGGRWSPPEAASSRGDETKTRSGRAASKPPAAEIKQIPGEDLSSTGVALCGETNKDMLETSGLQTADGGNKGNPKSSLNSEPETLNQERPTTQPSDHPTTRLYHLRKECKLKQCGQVNHSASTARRASASLIIEGEGQSVPRQRLDELALNYHWLAGLAVFPKTDHYRRKELTKFFEYMQAGIPILCSDMPAWKRFVEEQGIGVTVDPEDPDDQRRKIQWLLDHPDERRVMGERGRHLVETQYNWQTQADKLVKLYNELLKKNKQDGRKGTGRKGKT